MLTSRHLRLHDLLTSPLVPVMSLALAFGLTACSEAKKDTNQSEIVDINEILGPSDPSVQRPVSVEEGPIQEYVFPEYHRIFQATRVQGTFRLTAEIGENGKVFTVLGPSIPKEGMSFPFVSLAKVAQKNLCQWTFRPPSHQKDFPMTHAVEYIFKLEGEPISNPKPRYSIQLPDRIEITAAPHSIELVGTIGPDIVPNDGKSHHMFLSCKTGEEGWR